MTMVIYLPHHTSNESKQRLTMNLHDRHFRLTRKFSLTNIDICINKEGFEHTHECKPMLISRPP